MGEETVRAKASFKGYAQRHGVSIMYYHTGNGILQNKSLQYNVQAH